MSDPEFETGPEEDEQGSRLLGQYYEDLSKDNQNRAPGLWRLPRRHSFAHSYCFLLHDALGHMVVDAEGKLTSETFEMAALSEQERAEFIESELEGAKLIEWLEAHGQRDFVERLFEKRVVGALAADASTFTAFLIIGRAVSDFGKV